MIKIKFCNLLKSLEELEIGKNVQINTINAHSYNVAKKDPAFAKLLQESDYLLPDGQSVVWAKKWLTSEKLCRIAGYDLFEWEMNKVNEIGGKCFFLGSTEETLTKIKEKAEKEYPNITIETFSPPYKPEFSEVENQEMIERINAFQPHVLFVGMTAPKQEKWVSQNIQSLSAGHICSIGAVFDFYVGNIKRAPEWMQNKGLEWFYRLVKEPKRMWKRYIVGNSLFVYYIVKEKAHKKQMQ